MVGLKSEIADLNNCCASNLTKNALKVLSCLCCGVHVCKYFSHFQNEILLLPFNHFLPSYLCSPLWTFSLVSCFKKEKSKWVWSCWSSCHAGVSLCQQVTVMCERSTQSPPTHPPWWSTSPTTRRISSGRCITKENRQSQYNKRTKSSKQNTQNS